MEPADKLRILAISLMLFFGDFASGQINVQEAQKWRDTGNQLRVKKRYADAAAAYQKAVALDPNFWQAWQGLGNTYLHWGKKADALGAFEKAAVINPNDPILQKMVKILRVPPPAAAPKPSVAPKSPATAGLMAAAVAKEKSGAYEDAVDIYKQVLDVQPDNKEATQGFIASLLSIESYVEALEAYEKFSATQKTKTPRGMHAVMQQMPELSRNLDGDYLKAYQKLAASSKKNAEIFYRLGVAYMAVARYDKACDAFQNAVIEKPDFADANAYLGALLVRNGRVDAGEEAIQDAIRLKTEIPGAYMSLATICLDRKDIRQATDLFKHALQLNPNYLMPCAFAYLGKFDVAFQDEHIPYAFEVVAVAVRANPDDFWVRYCLAALNFRQGMLFENKKQLEKAVECYEKVYKYGQLMEEDAVELDQDEPEHGDTNVQEMNDDFAHAIGVMCRAYEQLNRWQNVVAMRRDAVRLQPKSSWNHFKLGEAYVKAGNVPSALKEHEILKGMDLQQAASLKALCDK